MKIKLEEGEQEELFKQDPQTAHDGGYQSLLIHLQERTHVDTWELEISASDIERINRYAFNYKQGGWQDRLTKIFARSLGPNLDGNP